jgi:hypothetical protein
LPQSVIRRRRRPAAQPRRAGIGARSGLPGLADARTATWAVTRRAAGPPLDRPPTPPSAGMVRSGGLILVVRGHGGTVTTATRSGCRFPRERRLEAQSGWGHTGRGFSDLLPLDCQSVAPRTGRGRAVSVAGNPCGHRGGSGRPGRLEDCFCLAARAAVLLRSWGWAWRRTTGAGRGRRTS